MATMIAIAGAALFYCFIVIAFSGDASRNDAVKRRLQNLERENSKAIVSTDFELSRSFAERVLRPAIQKVLRLLPATPRVAARNSAEKQKRMLQQAGWAISVEEYAVLQYIVLACTGAAGLMLAFLTHEDFGDTVLYFFGGLFAGYALLRYICSAAATKRKTAIEQQLPDMLDLLSISVVAGLGFERAIGHIIETMDGPLIDEFAVASREMTMGRSRKEALTYLGERCGVEDLSSVISALVQAGQLGIPIGNVLTAQAAAIRRSRRAKVQEKAAKISTKILFPMLFLIFPVLLIVLLGPSILTVMEQFG